LTLVSKRTAQFLKQLEKKEGKETKREVLAKSIAELDEEMNEEIRRARAFAESQELFKKKYMVGSKLGDIAPEKNGLIIMEISDRQSLWLNEMKDEVTKLMTEVLSSSTVNLATFSATSVQTWCPDFQNLGDAKKGLADAMKWLTKTVTRKACMAQPGPPDLLALLKRFIREGVNNRPTRIYMCCAGSFSADKDALLKGLHNLRQEINPDAADGDPVLPFNIVAFDPNLVGKMDENDFFNEIATPHGSFMIDTSKEDLAALDRMLKSVQKKKKLLEKHTRKLEKMEVLSDHVVEDRRLLNAQIALQRMLENDLEILEFALKNEASSPGEDGL